MVSGERPCPTKCSEGASARPLADNACLCWDRQARAAAGRPTGLRVPDLSPRRNRRGGNIDRRPGNSALDLSRLPPAECLDRLFGGSSPRRGLHRCSSRHCRGFDGASRAGRLGVAPRGRLSGAPRQQSRSVTLSAALSALLPDQCDPVIDRAVGTWRRKAARSDVELDFLVDRGHARRIAGAAASARDRRRAARAVARPRPAGSIADAFVLRAFHRHLHPRQQVGARGGSAGIPAPLPADHRQDPRRAQRTGAISRTIGAIF